MFLNLCNLFCSYSLYLPILSHLFAYLILPYWLLGVWGLRLRYIYENLQPHVAKAMRGAYFSIFLFILALIFLSLYSYL